MNKYPSSTMLYIAGSKRSYRCRCGTNVFHQTDEDRFVCNSCGIEYETSGHGEKIHENQITTNQELNREKLREDAEDFRQEVEDARSN